MSTEAKIGIIAVVVAIIAILLGQWYFSVQQLQEFRRELANQPRISFVKCRFLEDNSTLITFQNHSTVNDAVITLLRFTVTDPQSLCANRKGPTANRTAQALGSAAQPLT